MQKSIITLFLQKRGVLFGGVKHSELTMFFTHGILDIFPRTATNKAASSDASRLKKSISGCYELLSNLSIYIFKFYLQYDFVFRKFWPSWPGKQVNLAFIGFSPRSQQALWNYQLMYSNKFHDMLCPWNLSLHSAALKLIGHGFYARLRQKFSKFIQFAFFKPHTVNIVI